MADDSPELDDELGAFVEVRFHPQEWVQHGSDEHAEPASDTYETVFHVPVEDAVSDSGQPLADDSTESDVLKDHENAPERVQNWDGPFYITLQYGVPEHYVDEEGDVRPSRGMKVTLSGILGVEVQSGETVEDAVLRELREEMTDERRRQFFDKASLEDIEVFDE